MKLRVNLGHSDHDARTFSARKRFGLQIELRLPAVMIIIREVHDLDCSANSGDSREILTIIELESAIASARRPMLQNRSVFQVKQWSE